MNWDKIPEIDLYSDGGAEPNPGKGGFGIILSYKGKRKEFSQGYHMTTNNRMELLGIIYGLERLKTKSIVNIYSDSRYVINGITKGWAEKWRSNNWFRTKKELAINHDLWDRLLHLISKQQEVKFNWVKGHAGHIENERCDELATMALESENLLKDLGYVPKENVDNLVKVANYQNKSNTLKMENEGDPCRKCGVEIIKKQTKKRKIKANQTYYFDYYLLCPNCKTMYMVEAAKREIDKSEDTLFN